MKKDYKTSPEGRKNAKKYADIILLSRPHSSHPKMPLQNRAKLFAPFDALRGFDEAIQDSIQKHLDSYTDGSA